MSSLIEKLKASQAETLLEENLMSRVMVQQHLLLLDMVDFQNSFGGSFRYSRSKETKDCWWKMFTSPILHPPRKHKNVQGLEAIFLVVRHSEAWLVTWNSARHVWKWKRSTYIVWEPLIIVDPRMKVGEHHHGSRCQIVERLKGA